MQGAALQGQSLHRTKESQFPSWHASMHARPVGLPGPLPSNVSQGRLNVPFGVRPLNSLHCLTSRDVRLL
ncbi:hypothetical protein BASA61_007627 [Batrachochytrium salamandrivorans]|nr:hypothetical protein BASA61_007627 [Batrachochytrium salamandrivorans]